MSRQADIIREAKRRGFANLSDTVASEYDELRRAIRTREELVMDGLRMGAARVKEYIGWKQVEDERARENIGICRTNVCGSYMVLADGTEVCNRCNCMGADLYRKCKQDTEFCPHEPPLWDNRVPLTIKATDGPKPD